MKKFWSIQLSKNPKIGEILLYGVISSESWWGDEVTPKNFMKELDALGNIDELHVYINSPGGDVFAGHALYNIIKRNKTKKKVCHIDGLAASAATLPALACELHMPLNSMFMIHNPWSWGIGESKDLRKLADDLDKVRESIIVVYQEKTGMSKEEIIDYMDAETWFTAEEGYNLGFADILEESKEIVAMVKNEYDMEIMSKYKNIPERVKKMSDNTKNKTEEAIIKLEAANKELAASNKQLIDGNKDLNAKLEASISEVASLKAEIEALKTDKQPKEPSVLDSLSEDVKNMIIEAQNQAKAAQEQVKKMQDEQLTNAFIAKAKGFECLGIKADEFGPVLKAVSEIDVKYLDTLEAVLKAANASAEQGKLFKEIGNSRNPASIGDSWSKIESSATALMQRDASIQSKEEAVAKFLETVEGKQLYEAYLSERSWK